METRRPRLDGWKEIASELGVSERTARRYEVQERLPVRRHMHEARGSVYAWSDELASWKQGRSTAMANDLPGRLPDDRVIKGCESHGKPDREIRKDAEGWNGRVLQHLPLIGSGREWKSALRALAAAQAGGGSVVLIGGEPGVGKTHFIRVLLEEVRRRGCFGLTGHCREMEGEPPYVAFVELLENFERSVPLAAFRTTLGDSAVEISRVMPKLRQIFADLTPPIEVPPDQQRRLIFNAWRCFFERSAHRQPTIAVFEDLQWADEATLLLLSYLSQSLSMMPLLLVGTYRTIEADISPPLAHFLESCLRDKSATCLNLRRLALPDVAVLLDELGGQKAPEPFVRFIFDRTDGNPFFVEELFRELQAQEKLFREPGAWNGALEDNKLNVPPAIRLLIGRRLNRLKQHTQKVMRLAAVLGRSFSVALLEELEPSQPETLTYPVIDSLEEAERAYLIEVDHGGREPTYRFIHELVRQTVLESFSLPRRQRLHARIGEAIERVYASKPETQVSVLAHHYFEAGSLADAGKTVSCLLMAARSATASAAHENALALVEKALSVAQCERPQEVAHIVAFRSAILRSLSRISEAIDAYQRAIEMFTAAGESAEAAAASYELGHILIWQMDFARAHAVVDRAIKSLGMRAPLTRYRLELLKALGLGVKGEMEGAFAALAEARQIESTLPNGSSDAIGYGRMSEAHVCYFSARIEEAAECGRAAVAIFRAAGNVWAEVDTYEVLSGIVYKEATIAQTEITLSKALQRAQQIGHQGAIWTYRFMFAELFMHRGELERAQRTAEELHDFAVAVSAPWAFLDYVLLAAIAHYRGDLEAAARWSRRGLALEPECYMSGQDAGCLFWALAAKEDPEAEYALAAARPHLPVPGKILTFGSCSCLAFVIEGLAISGRVEEAAALQPGAEWVLANAPDWLYSRHLFRTSSAIVAGCARDWARAETHHQAALHIADSTGCQVARPGARYWYADMLCSRALPGDEQRAQDLLREALHLAESTAMVWEARRAALRLADWHV